VGHPQILSKADTTRRSYQRMKALSLASLIQHKLYVLYHKTYTVIIQTHNGMSTLKICTDTAGTVQQAEVLSDSVWPRYYI
jgi:hypothetical protein